MATTVDLIRHGEPVGGRKYRGQIDDPLSDKGWRQMREAVADHHPWQQILTSPLLRCREFAHELAQRHQLPLETDPRWMEIGFGEWEGKTAEDIRAEDPQKLQRFMQDPITLRPPGAEPMTDFHDRISSAWQDLLTRFAERHTLVVCHAGVIRMSMLYLLGMPMKHVFRVQVSNASITRFVLERVDEEWFPRLHFHGGRL